MSESDRPGIGFVYWACQMALLLVVAGVLHLGVLSLDTLFILVLIAIMGVIFAVLAVSIRGGIVPVPFTLKTAAVTIGGFVALLLMNLGLNFFFGAPLAVSFGGEDYAGRLLVNILAAICEEDLFFGVYCLAKVSNVPDFWVMFLSCLVFWALHALVYNIYALEVVLFLTAGRLVFTGIYAVSDHSDPPFVIHILWNVINT